jgi:hypothetical protein
MIAHDFHTVGYWAMGPCRGRLSGTVYYVAKIGDCWVLRYRNRQGEDHSIYCTDHKDVIEHLKDIESGTYGDR